MVNSVFEETVKARALKIEFSNFNSFSVGKVTTMLGSHIAILD